MSSEAATAVVKPTPKAATPVLREPSLTPTLEADDTPAFPVSMVVHDGTGILHGNMTSLTVNQYIGVVPDRGAWDSGRVRELMADAVKVSAEANSQLFNPSASDDNSSAGLINKNSRRKNWWILLFGTILLCVVPLGTITMYTKLFSPAFPQLEAFHPTTSLPEEVSDSVADEDDDLVIMPRTSWNAMPRKAGLRNLTLPVTRVIALDTRTEPCYVPAECVKRLLNEQSFDVQGSHFPDISYNFYIGGDGRVYVGRGWDFVGSITNSFNNGSVGIAFIRMFNETLPNEGQMTAFNKLVALGVKGNKISANYTLVNICQLLTDGYNDLALTTNMTSWPHFDRSFPISRCG